MSFGQPAIRHLDRRLSTGIGLPLFGVQKWVCGNVVAFDARMKSAEQMLNVRPAQQRPKALQQSRFGATLPVAGP